jgi:2-C-methyl-D-erythritol 2,4-cyclodiphosphate synthase
MKIRTGFGYDVHRLVAGRALWLGGIKIEHSEGLLGHSDADVLLHAICDALLGAAALGDIGYHFPDTSSDFKDADSKHLLARVREMLHEHGYGVGNIDCVICAQRPRLSPYITQMRETIASILAIDVSCVSVKATTTEHLGFVGREEGIAAYATVLIEQA